MDTAINVSGNIDSWVLFELSVNKKTSLITFFFSFKLLLIKSTNESYKSK